MKVIWQTNAKKGRSQVWDTRREPKTQAQQQIENNNNQ